MKKWKLITYNIHKGVGPFGRLSVVDRVKVGLRASDADFLLLQEVEGEHLDRPKVQQHLEALADERWPHHAYGKNAVFPRRNHGNAILSSVPIKAFHNQDLTVYPIEKRGLLHCELDWGRPGLHLCSVHLDLFEITRSRQVENVVAYLKKSIPAKAPLVLGGDFNDWARKIGPLLAEELGLEEFSAPSFPSWAPLLRLDRLYVRGVKVEGFRVLEDPPWNELSDHLPLCLEFRH